MTGRPAIDGRAIPVLASLDLEETAAFYRKLGFVTEVYPAVYVIAVRGPLEIHFWACDERHIAENTSCYIRVAGVDALYEEFRQVDMALGRMGKVADRPWGMREFHVWDPHGNLIKIGQIVGGGSE